MNPFEFPDNILRYSEEHTSEVDPVLQELYRITNLKTVHPQMLSGKVQGQFLSFVSKLLQPKAILEIGTFTGYSAYCLQKGLKSGGMLTSIEVNEELEDIIRRFFRDAEIESKTKLLIGDALKILPELHESFDLIFIDANKEHYPAYYQACIEKLNPGGVLIADNVLWGGKVVAPEARDHSSLVLNEFNDMVQADPRVENVFLTLRDGLLLVRKL